MGSLARGVPTDWANGGRAVRSILLSAIVLVAIVLGGTSQSDANCGHYVWITDPAASGAAGLADPILAVPVVAKPGEEDQGPITAADRPRSERKLPCRGPLCERHESNPWAPWTLELRHHDDWARPAAMVRAPQLANFVESLPEVDEHSRARAALRIDRPPKT